MKHMCLRLVLVMLATALASCTTNPAMETDAQGRESPVAAGVTRDAMGDVGDCRDDGFASLDTMFTGILEKLDGNTEMGRFLLGVLIIKDEVAQAKVIDSCNAGPVDIAKAFNATDQVKMQTYSTNLRSVSALAAIPAGILAQGVSNALLLRSVPKGGDTTNVEIGTRTLKTASTNKTATIGVGGGSSDGSGGTPGVPNGANSNSGDSAITIDNTNFIIGKENATFIQSSDISAATGQAQAADFNNLLDGAAGTTSSDDDNIFGPLNR